MNQDYFFKYILKHNTEEKDAQPIADFTSGELSEPNMGVSSAAVGGAQFILDEQGKDAVNGNMAAQTQVTGQKVYLRI